MSKSGAAPAPVPGSEANLPFEEALERLEGIVEAMENDDLPLETLLAKFEEGSRLARSCQSRLADAEIKIQQLEKSTQGQFTLKPVSVSQPSAA